MVLKTMITGTDSRVKTLGLKTMIAGTDTKSQDTWSKNNDYRDRL